MTSMNSSPSAESALAETGDVRRFPSRHHFASYTGTAPVDVSPGDNTSRTRSASLRAT